ncbi:hypothetical protein B0H14DRAFT_2637092 [Mycena olivaceomarginata]|nr:hypothetical protein B0H14DRAFT_2637092 [Mycena olivaceomarginata]
MVYGERGFNSPPVHYLPPIFWLRLILAHPRLVVLGQEYTYMRNAPGQEYMQQAPVVYGTPTESVDIRRIERWTGFDSPPVHIRMVPTIFFKKLHSKGSRVEPRIHGSADCADRVRYTHQIKYSIRIQLKWWMGIDSQPGQEYMQQAPVVYGTPTDVCGYKRTIPKSVEQGKARKERTRTSTVTVGLGQEGLYEQDDYVQQLLRLGRGGALGDRVRIQRGREWDEESAHVVPLHHRSSRGRRRRQRQRPTQREWRARAHAHPCSAAVAGRGGGDGVRPGGGGTCELRRRGGRGRERRSGAARGDKGEVLIEEDARVVDSCSSGSSTFPTANCVGANSSPSASPLSSLSSTSSSLARARNKRRDGDAAASPRAAHPGARSVAGLRCTTLTVPFANGSASSYTPSPSSAGSGMNEYGRSALEYREECERELVAEKEEAVGEGGACEASDEQGDSDESGEGGGEPGAQVRPEQCGVDAGRGLGRSRSGNWKGEPPPPHDERRGALLELAEHQAHAGGAGGGMQVLHGLFALQGRVARRCAEEERKGRGRGSNSSAAEMRARNSARLKGERRAGDVDGDLDDEGECMAGVEGKDEEGKLHGVI